MADRKTEAIVARGVYRAVLAVDDLLRKTDADSSVSQTLRTEIALAAVGGYVGADTSGLPASE